MNKVTFQLLTAGLFSGDDIEILINYRVETDSWWRNSPWEITIFGTLDGQTATPLGYYHIGTYGGHDNILIKFTGKMPSRQSLTGELVFKIRFPAAVFDLPTEIDRITISIPNLDDVPPPPPPNGEPPAVCTEGQTRCDGHDLLICRSGAWQIKEYNSAECGYVLPPICTEGTRKCVGTTLKKCVNNQWITEETNSPTCGYVPPEPPPNGNGNGYPPSPPDIGDWFERNKTIIIVIAVAVLIIATILLFQKKQLGVQNPVTFRRPITRRPIARR